MNAFIERNGVTVASGSKIKPNEQITLRVGNTGFWTLSVVFRVWDASGNLILEENATTAVGTGEAWVDWVTPAQEGDYQFQAFGVGSGISHPINFTVSNSASSPPIGPGNLGEQIVTILKWTAVAGIVIAGGYFVVKSGLFDTGTSAVKRKLAEKKSVA